MNILFFFIGTLSSFPAFSIVWYPSVPRIVVEDKDVDDAKLAQNIPGYSSWLPGEVIGNWGATGGAICLNKITSPFQNLTVSELMSRESELKDYIKSNRNSFGCLNAVLRPDHIATVEYYFMSTTPSSAGSKKYKAARLVVSKRVANVVEDPTSCTAHLDNMAFVVSDPQITLSNTQLDVFCNRQSDITISVNDNIVFEDASSGAKIKFDYVTFQECTECHIPITGIMMLVPPAGRYSWSVPVSIDYL
ncbi:MULTISPECIES: hypothetical protein [unclassified Vibrio]|uniref:hypothetical protein n=3 Tax=Vibrio TaxID=662 RepID=UPI001130258D|nr:MULTISPECIES: hypothetical protein [unclassified Vibrio]NAW89098.1 hypothetical protein [Vibrio sp. V24_P1S3T111]